MTSIRQLKTKLDAHTGRAVREARSKRNPHESVGSNIFMNRAAVKAAELDFLAGGLLERAAMLALSSKTEEGEVAVRMLDLAAGPGGFSEYCLWRWAQAKVKKPNNTKQKAKGSSASLLGDPRLGPLMVDAVTLANSSDFTVDKFHPLVPKENFCALYGPNGTGDLQESGVGQEIRERAMTQGGYHLVWADGGIDVRGKENFQEQLTLPLLANELALASEVLARSGSFVCKLYDTECLCTKALLQLIASCFEECTLLKPVTSRPANSEQYFVGVGFRGDYRKNTNDTHRGDLDDKLETLDPTQQCSTLLRRVAVDLSGAKLIELCSSGSVVSARVAMHHLREVEFGDAFCRWLESCTRRRLLEQRAALQEILSELEPPLSCAKKRRRWDSDAGRDRDAIVGQCLKQWKLPNNKLKSNMVNRT